MLIGRRLRALALSLAGCVLSLGLHPCAASAQSTPAGDERFDVLFLAAEAPLWLTIRLAGGRDSLHAVRRRYALVVLRTVDADGDDLADATEAARLPARGRPGKDAPLLGENWMDFDTSPADGRLSPDEYLAAVEPYLGPMFTIRRKAPLPIQSVQLLPSLDGDGDGRISAEEIRAGTQTLTAFDFDDDGTFSPAELQPFPQSMLDAATAEQSGSRFAPFVLVDEQTDRRELCFALFEKYKDGAEIPRKHSGLPEFAFDDADRDGSGGLNETEAEALLRPRPAAEVVVDLAGGQVRAGRIARRSGRVKELPVEHPRRLGLQLESEAVELSAHDNRYAASDQIKLLKIRFLQGDGDKNGYMNEQEFAGLAGMNAAFADVDADGDGKVFIEELERFLRIDSYLSQCALEMEIADVDKPLFVILDSNLDRRLSRREFAFGIDRLQEFDRSGDGVLDTRELNLLSRFRVKFSFVMPPAVRPEQNNAMASQQRMPRVGQMTQAGPEWFVGMDRNQDGEVTWREFLGPREAFDSLDRDDSGWIDPPEAEAAGDDQ